MISNCFAIFFGLFFGFWLPVFATVHIYDRYYDEEKRTLKKDKSNLREWLDREQRLNTSLKKELGERMAKTTAALREGLVNKFGDDDLCKLVLQISAQATRQRIAESISNAILMNDTNRLDQIRTRVSELIREQIGMTPKEKVV